MYILYKFVSRLSRKIGVILLSFLLLFTLFIDLTNLTTLIGANSLLSIKHEPFDGLVYPYQYAPDWVALKDSERQLAFNEISPSKILDPLRYDPLELAMSTDSLGFSSEKDIKIRNAKITYSVPYMGNYKLDGLENAGSHPAVDVKLPVGTPILAIGNAVVVKSENLDWGFGKHVVLRHNDFPDFNDQTKTTTYFSSYSHMSQIDVEVGTVVRKGQRIGLSGESGTATTQHLHFQIDKASAPWQPFWPFTATEATAAGVSMFEGINVGLGKELALEMTINPMLYVQKHLSSVSPQVASSVVNYNDNYVTTLDNDSKKLVFITPESMIVGKTYDVELQYTGDSNGYVASISDENYKIDANLLAEYVLPNSIAFDSTKSVVIPFTPKESGNMNITANFGDLSTKSPNVDVRVFKDIQNSDPDLKSFRYLKNRGIMKGFPDDTFAPDLEVNRAQAIKLISSIVNNNSQTTDLKINFKDVNSNDWYYDSLVKLVSLGSVNTDNVEFKPNNSVTLAEFLKILFLSLQIDVNPTVDSKYAEYFDKTQWYAPYIQEAIKQEIITLADVQNAFEPMNRRTVARFMGEVLQMIENL